MTKIFDATRCALGEGPLWHPERKALIWFDILGQVMHMRGDDNGHHWSMGEFASAAGWVDYDTLILATESGLYRFDLASGARDLIVPLERDNPLTRSNDGRADPMGGFWIGTMGKGAEPGAGAIYRYYKGELRKLLAPVTISNAICFSPDGRLVYFADTAEQAIRRMPLDGEGWPSGASDVFIDLSKDDLNPDGAVTDADGRIWNAQWGAGRVACYEPDGSFRTSISIPASQATCPAFAGPDFATLLVTSAAEGVDEPHAGQTFALVPGVTGRAEPRVVL